jgi:hypothetical protein
MVKLQQNDKQLHKEKLENSVFRIRAAGWIRIQSSQWIRSKETKIVPKKKGEKIMFVEFLDFGHGSGLDPDSATAWIRNTGKCVQKNYRQGVTPQGKKLLFDSKGMGGEVSSVPACHGKLSSFKSIDISKKN